MKVTPCRAVATALLVVPVLGFARDAKAYKHITGIAPFAPTASEPYSVHLMDDHRVVAIETTGKSGINRPPASTSSSSRASRKTFASPHHRNEPVYQHVGTESGVHRKALLCHAQDAGQAEAFAVVGQALINAERATIGQIAFAGRKSIIAVVPAEDRGTMAYTLRFESEIRSRSDYFRDIAEAPVNANALEMAEMLIVKRTAKFEPPKCVDGYEVAVRELVDARLKNQPLTVAPAPQNVGSLMDALRQSVGPMLVVKAPAKAPKATKTA